FRLSLFPRPDDRLRRPALSLFQAARLAVGKAGFSHTSVAPPTGAARGLDPRAIFRERPSRKGPPAGPRVTPVGSNCVWKVFRASRPRISLLQIGHDQLLHLHHRRHGAAGAFGVGAQNRVAELAGGDLPGDAEAVLAPAALPLGAAARNQAFPEMVHLRLAVALD